MISTSEHAEKEINKKTKNNEISAPRFEADDRENINFSFNFCPLILNWKGINN